MKFVVSKKRLLSAIRSVLPAVGTRSTLPVLSGLRITATNAGVTIEGTDLEAFVREAIRNEVTVKQHGVIVTQAKALAKVVSSMTTGEITVESMETEGRSRVALRSGARTITLDCLPVDDFPSALDEKSLEEIASVEAPTLASSFARAVLCASKDEARPPLTSVALFLKEGSSTIQLVATDSYRMGILDVPMHDVAAEDRTMLVPARVVNELAKRFRTCRGAVSIRVPDREGTSLVVFSFGSAFWSTRLIEGEFPNWQQIVPGETGAAVEFEVEELASVLKAAEAVSNGNGMPIRLSLGQTTTLSLIEGDQSVVRETLATAAFTPDGVGEIEVAFNPSYFADALKFVGDERARLWVRDGLKPALIGPPDRRYVLMPVRLS
jgi:DNA polymerase-3 subunit beta